MPHSRGHRRQGGRHNRFHRSISSNSWRYLQGRRSWPDLIVCIITFLSLPLPGLVLMVMYMTGEYSLSFFVTGTIFITVGAVVMGVAVYRYRNNTSLEPASMVISQGTAQAVTTPGSCDPEARHEQQPDEGSHLLRATVSPTYGSRRESVASEM